MASGSVAGFAGTHPWARSTSPTGETFHRPDAPCSAGERVRAEAGMSRYFVSKAPGTLVGCSHSNFPTYLCPTEHAARAARAH